MKHQAVLLNKVVAMLSLLVLSVGNASAQRDYDLIVNRNAWLTSDNAAALTTFSDSSISRGEIYGNYTSGGWRTISEGKEEWTIGADVRSYYRLTDRLVAYGDAAYKNFNGTQMDGSMFFKAPNYAQSLEPRPFDLLDDSITNTGDKHYELFHIVGGIGWNVWQSLSIGAKADFTAGSYAKYKDLRHRNTLMNFNTNFSVLYNIKERASVGAAFLYRRNTETMQYEVKGTTDQVYKTFINYANGIGEVETFGGDGFTDSNGELPLFNEYFGFSVQGAWNIGKAYKHGTTSSQAGSTGGTIYGTFSYQHRRGYYGKESQYTASHEQHGGNVLDWNLRYTLPQGLTGKSLQWVALHINDEQLTVNRTNYREAISSDNVKSYEYFTPTKMSDKILRQGDASYTGYFTPGSNTSRLERHNVAESLYLWHVTAGLSWLHSKQTAYLNLDMNTAERTIYIPHILVARHFLFHSSSKANASQAKGTSMLTAEAGFSLLTGDSDKATDLHLRCAYEIPLHAVPGLRPSVSLSYDWKHCTTAFDASSATGSRHDLLLCIGALF